MGADPGQGPPLPPWPRSRPMAPRTVRGPKVAQWPGKRRETALLRPFQSTSDKPLLSDVGSNRKTLMITGTYEKSTESPCGVMTPCILCQYTRRRAGNPGDVPPARLTRRPGPPNRGPAPALNSRRGPPEPSGKHTVRAIARVESPAQGGKGRPATRRTTGWLTKSGCPIWCGAFARFAKGFACSVGTAIHHGSVAHQSTRTEASQTPLMRPRTGPASRGFRC